jgi:hypothetical protein
MCNCVIRQDLPVRYQYVPADLTAAESGLIRNRSVAFASGLAPDG